MTELDQLLKKIGVGIPGLIVIGLVGFDGLTIASYSSTFKFELDLAAAQLSMIMQLIQKTVKLLDEEIEDNLITTEDIFLYMASLGASSYNLCIAVERKKTALGTIRMLAQQNSQLLQKSLQFLVQ